MSAPKREFIVYLRDHSGTWAIKRLGCPRCARAYAKTLARQFDPYTNYIVVQPAPVPSGDTV